MLGFFMKLLVLHFILSATCYAEIRAMTINTEWLWTPFDKKVDGSLKHLRDMPEKGYLEEINFYAKQIQAKNIDIVALSEIENEQVANELVKILNDQLGPKWKTHFKQGRDSATGQDVAIISKLPYVEGSVTDFNFPAGFIAGAGKAKKLSKIVGAKFWVNGATAKKKLGVITAHLLSKRHENKKKAANREKQALGLKKAIDSYLEDSDALIVMGDFNDYLNSSTLNIIMADQLSTYQACDNFSVDLISKETKRWLRHIDHLLYSGFHCQGQYKLDLQGYSDHPAIYGEFNFRQSK